MFPLTSIKPQQPKVIVALLLACWLLSISLLIVDAAPYQELAPRAGHVPVYIRVGDTPLSEIHPALAEAFGEFESASLTLEDKEAAAELPVAPAEAQTEEKPATEGTKTAEASETTAAPQPQQPSDIASFDVIKALDEAAEKQAEVAADDADAKTE